MRIDIKVAVLLVSLMGVSSAVGGEIEPFVTGTVFHTGVMFGKLTVGGRGATEKSRQLAEQQLHELYSWLSAHQPNAHMILSSPPPPSCSVLLSDANGRQIQLDLYSVSESWKHVVQIVIYDVSDKFLYGGEMTLPNAEMAALREILKTPN